MEEINVIEQMICYLSTPIAKRKGVTISPEDCAIWVDELKKYTLTPQVADFLAWLNARSLTSGVRGENDCYHYFNEVIAEFKQRFNIGK